MSQVCPPGWKKLRVRRRDVQVGDIRIDSSYGGTITKVEVTAGDVTWLTRKDGPDGLRYTNGHSDEVISVYRNPNKENKGMNPLANKVFNHLTASGHSERLQALEDLVVHLHLDDDALRPVLESYLSKNERRFCDAGIKRFKDAIGLKPKPKKFTAHVVLIEDKAGVSSGQLIGEFRLTLGKRGIASEYVIGKRGFEQGQQATFTLGDYSFTTEVAGVIVE